MAPGCRGRDYGICLKFTIMDSDKMTRLAEFISAHGSDDPDRLALQKDRWPEVDVAAAVSTLVSRKKLAAKAPLWAKTEGLVLPRTLSAEQCSGEAAARHKSALLEAIWNRLQGHSHGDDGECGHVSRNPRIADLTGGLGVDSLAFSKIAEAVLYNDMNPELAEAAEHNFVVLGAENIEVCSYIADSDSLSPESDSGAGVQSGVTAGALARRLMEFRPDVIYLDPARRDGCGKKVFLLEDCSPDILKLKDRLLEIAPVLMVKLSPMADISMVIDRLGSCCRELHIVEARGECKELLAVLLRNGYLSSENSDIQNNDAQKECVCSIVNLDGDALGSPLSFRRSEETRRTGLRFAEKEDIVPGALLFEPGKALMKAGCFNLLGKTLGAAVLGRDTHYYILGEDSAGTGPETESGNMRLPDVVRYGKLFRILNAAVLSGKSMKEFGRRHPEAEVTARGVKMTSDEVRRRLECRPSERYHIFALHADNPGHNLLLFCEKYSFSER